MRIATRPGKIVAEHQPGDGSGYAVSGNSLSLSEVAPTLIREHRVVLSETLSLSESMETATIFGLVIDETLVLSEFENTQLTGKINDAGSRAHGSGVGTLTTGFGQGGFGQAGFGGSTTFNA